MPRVCLEVGGDDVKNYLEFIAGLRSVLEKEGGVVAPREGVDVGWLVAGTKAALVTVHPSNLAAPLMPGMLTGPGGVRAVVVIEGEPMEAARLAGLVYTIARRHRLRAYPSIAQCK